MGDACGSESAGIKLFAQNFLVGIPFCCIIVTR